MVTADTLTLGSGRMWPGQSKLAEAHDLLAPVYGCFTGDLDTRACGMNALLDELR